MLWIGYLFFVLIMIGSGHFGSLFDPLSMIGLLNILFLVTCIGGTILLVNYGLKHEEEIQTRREEELKEGRQLRDKYLKTKKSEDLYAYREWMFTKNNGQEAPFL